MTRAQQRTRKVTRAGVPLGTTRKQVGFKFACQDSFIKVRAPSWLFAGPRPSKGLGLPSYHPALPGTAGAAMSVPTCQALPAGGSA